MSIFNTQAKKMRTSIMGNETELKVNNGVWVILKDKYKVKQTEWGEQYEAEPCMAGCTFISAVLESNGFMATPEEVASNTRYADIIKFMLDYNNATFEKSETPVEPGESQR